MADKDNSAQHDVSKFAKVKPRPPKLKNPLENVLQGESEMSSHHRPIGTPPPASLRRSRQSFDLSSSSVYDPLMSSSTTSVSPTLNTSECFPQINVVNSPEGETAFPALTAMADAASADAVPLQSQSTPHSNTKRPPIDNQRRSMSVDNNNPIDLVSPKGLTPPQRLVTRDQDGVVFELSGGIHPDN